MRAGDVVELDGTPFGIVSRVYASRCHWPDRAWTANGPAWLARSVALVVVVRPFEPAGLARFAYVTRREVLGYAVPRVGRARGRELVIARGRGPVTRARGPRSAKRV